MSWDTSLDWWDPMPDVNRQAGDSGAEKRAPTAPQPEQMEQCVQPAECSNCHGTGVDPAWPRPPCVCPVGLALRDELEQSEPVPGRCANCPREGEVWYVHGQWLCWKCREGA